MRFRNIFFCFFVFFLACATASASLAQGAILENAPPQTIATETQGQHSKPRHSPEKITSEGRGDAQPVVTHCGARISKEAIACNKPNRRVVIQFLDVN